MSIKFIAITVAILILMSGGYILNMFASASLSTEQANAQAYRISQSTQVAGLNTTISNQNINLTATSAQLATAQANNIQKSNDLATKDTELAAQKSTVDQLRKDLDTSAQSLQSAQLTIEGYKNSQADYLQLSADVRKYKEVLQCSDSNIQKFDYSSNQTISDNLKSFLGSQSSITTATWETVWNNSLTTIHHLKGKYLYVFIVTFNEPTFNKTPSVYDVSGRCFLDLQ